MAKETERAGAYRARWGEGPIWHGGVLHYVDIEDHKVVTYDPAAGGERVIDVGERPGTVVPRARGGLVVAGDSGFSFLDPGDPDPVLEPVADPEAGVVGNRFNDGKCDPAGRFWAGSIALDKRPNARLYRLDPDLSVHEMFGPVTNSNGICWDEGKGLMYYIDTPRKKVLVFDYDVGSGGIANPRTAVDTGGLEGVPDGMAIDAEGLIWVAMVRGGKVVRFDPDGGAAVSELVVPCSGPTAVAFGGEGLRDLYITTGQFAGQDEPGAGYLYLADPGVAGVAGVAFAG